MAPMETRVFVHSRSHGLFIDGVQSPPHDGGGISPVSIKTCENGGTDVLFTFSKPSFFVWVITHLYDS